MSTSQHSHNTASMSYKNISTKLQYFSTTLIIKIFHNEMQDNVSHRHVKKHNAHSIATWKKT